MPNYPILTEIMLRAAKAPARGQTMLWDGAVKHFGVRVNQGGAKSYIVLLRSGRRQTIGRYPRISLAQARTLAKQILAEHTLGKRQSQSINYNEAVERFLAESETKNRARTVKDYSRLLRKDVAFGAKGLGDISKSDVARKMDALLDVPAERNHAIVAAKIFFNWAVRSGYLDQSPCIGLTPSRRPTRERALTNDELRKVLRRALEGYDNFSYIVAILILTGQRRTEVGSLRWGWIDRRARTITLPSTITKNKRTHAFPYGEMVDAVFGRITESSEYLFPASREHVNGTATTSFNGWAKSKLIFDGKCAIDPWTLHDLRRTVATNLAGLGTAPHVVERILNHASGTISGVAAIYNRFSYMDDMRDALGRWEAQLAKLLAS